MSVLDGVHWIAIVLGIAFGAATFAYYAWTFGLGARMRDVGRMRITVKTSQLLGRHGERDPADTLQQSLHDALHGAHSDLSEPDDEWWIPDVRVPVEERASTRQTATRSR